MSKTLHFDRQVLASATEALDFIGGLLDTLTDYAISVQDLNGKFLQWNEGARRLYGYQAAEIADQTVSLLHTPEDIAAGKIQKIHEDTLRVGKWEGVVTRIRKSGQRFDAHVLYTLRRDSEGNPVGFLVISNDVSKEGRRLWHAEHRFRGLLETAPDAIVIINTDGQILLANAQAEKLFGYGQDELLRYTIEKLLPERFRAQHKSSRQQFLRNPRTRRMGNGLDLYGLRKDGSEFPADISLGSIETEDGLLLTSAIRDITDLKHMEALHFGEARVLEMIASGTPVEESLSSLLHVIESQSQGMYCSVLLLDEDGKHVRHVAAPSLPVPYTRAVDGKTIGPQAGSCGTAMFLGKPVIVTDILTDPLWENHRDVVIPYGFRACWSNPIFSSDGRVLGSFAMYYREVRSPSATEKRLIEIATHISSIALEQKAAQDALRVSEERFSKAFHDNPVPMGISRVRDQIIVDVNESMVRLLGYSREQLIGHTSLEAGIVDELPPRRSSGSRNGHPWNDAVRTREMSLRTKSGEWRTVMLSSTVTRVGDENCFLGSIVDITDRKRADEALRKSEEEYRSFFESNLAGNWVSTPTGELLECNPAFARIFGFASVEEAMKTNFASFYPEPGVRESLLKLLREKGRLEQAEVELRRIDGVPVHVIMNAISRFDGRGNLVQVFGHIIDDTTRKKTEQQLIQAQKMEAVGQLAGGIAHDFNNILAAILGFSDLLLEEMNSFDPARARIREIRKAGERAASLTRQLLAFSRRQVMQLAVLDLNAIVGNLGEMLRRLIGEDIELAVHLDPALAQVRVDHSQMEQVILNLVVNARDAMPKGGTLTLETANVELDEIGAREHAPAQPGSYVMLSVKDTGTGMDQQTRARIFEPFFSTKGLNYGTGLGLSTVYGIVKQSSGYIWVHSEVGRGTTFEIYLPRMQAQTAKSDAALVVAPTPKGTETVLLVEDASPLRQLLHELLDGSGYHVLSADGPQQALEISKSFDRPITLLLTDLVMPKMNGRMLAERLTAQRPEMKVLYMSGYAANPSSESTILPPDVPFLQKPFSKDALMRKIREVLDAPPMPIVVKVAKKTKRSDSHGSVSKPN